MTAKRLVNKVAIVTGAARGFGRATAVALAREGAVIAGLDLEDDLASLVRLYVAGLCGLAYGALTVLLATRVVAPAARLSNAWDTRIGGILSDTLGANLQLAYSDNKTFAAAANLKWNPVPGLLIEPEVTYTKWDSIDEDQWNGMIRFQRTF